LAIAALLAGCSHSRGIRVGSKNFTEQLILGEIAAQHLERRLGVAVDRRLNLGGTLLAHQALASGQIDVLPEYTGTALTSVLKMKPASDAGEVFRSVRREYRSRWRLEWLDPLGFNNTFAMVIRGEEARAAGIKTISDAARVRAGWRLGAGYEFEQRPDGLAGLLRTYGLFLREPPKSMDLGLLYKALEQRQVDMIAANSTDGLLSVLDVRVLEDDQRYFPPYQAALVVRSGLLLDPEVKKALAELSGKFSDETMRRLNHQVDGEHRRASDVAAAFLERAGLSAPSPR
jgi:glycine betaine/choline ABC-type transport system substrate-binding protein